MDLLHGLMALIDAPPADHVFGAAEIGALAVDGLGIGAIGQIGIAQGLANLAAEPAVSQVNANLLFGFSNILDAHVHQERVQYRRDGPQHMRLVATAKAAAHAHRKTLKLENERRQTETVCNSNAADRFNGESVTQWAYAMYMLFVSTSFYICTCLYNICGW